MSRATGIIIGGVCLLAAGLLLLPSVVAPRLQLAVVGLAIGAVVSVPMVTAKRFDPISPWTVVLMVVAIGVVGRSLIVSFGWPTPERVDDLFLRGRDAESLVRGASYILVAYGLFTLAYLSRLVPGPRYANSRPLPRRTFVIPESRLLLLCAASVLIGAFAFVAYVQQTGGFDPQVLSGKRTVITRLDIESDPDYRGLGWLGILGRLPLLVALIAICWWAKQGLLSNARIVIVAILAIVSVGISLYGSGRGTVALTVLQLIIAFGWSRGGLRARPLVLGGLAMALLVSSMSAIRHVEDVGWEDVAGAMGIRPAAEAVIVNRNMNDMTVAATIVEEVPRSLDHQWGRTYWAWVVAPVPRELWPAKPLVHSGPIIGTELYGTSRAGVPPGLFAELYWNFGLVGLLDGSLGAGFALGAVWSYFQKRRDEWWVGSIYAAAVPVLVVGALSKAFGAGLVRAAFASAQVLFLCWLVSNVRHQRESGLPERGRAALPT
jgi:hypothetical protein